MAQAKDSRLGITVILEVSWFQAIIVRGKNEKFYSLCVVDIGICFYVWTVSTDIF